MDRFALGIGWRLTAILLLMGSGVAVYYWLGSGAVLVPIGVVLIGLVVNLYQYVTGINRKLIRFLESVQYADFAVSFRTDNQLGPTFQALNRQFNAVLDAFRQARADKETSLHYVNTIVQHVSVGLLTFDAGGQVELINQTALRLLGIYRLRTLAELDATHPDLTALFWSVTGASGPVVYRMTTDDELSIRGTAVQLRGRRVTIVSIQNIRSELQQRELDAWQNLTKVLRHEIMNSITPIVSLVGTMRDIVDTDLAPTPRAVQSNRIGWSASPSRLLICAMP
ncbi:sensor histidine kinase [Spirosoma rhododendri]|uniref:sensor histidine kinase n=1 Tax=Spirosoma rhododendri TaxID=2728024 RepID=UPI0020C24151|nr:PAS domain-containing protein [Spirosoma rhododendri]